MLTIRPANLADADSIYALGSSIPEFAVSGGTVNFWPLEILTRAIESDDVLVLVALQTELVGFVIVNLNKGLSKAIIENIYVHPDSRGNDIGYHLVSRAISTLRERSYAYVITLVPADADQAVKVYQRNGFQGDQSFLWLDQSLDEMFIRGD
jgi:ribosomal protein S18 acetylase RimI-like enzyme